MALKNPLVILNVVVLKCRMGLLQMWKPRFTHLHSLRLLVVLNSPVILPRKPQEE